MKIAAPQTQGADLFAIRWRTNRNIMGRLLPCQSCNPAAEALVRGCQRMSACHPVCAALSLDRSRLEAIPANKGPFVRDNRRLSGRRAVRGGRIIRYGGAAR